MVGFYDHDRREPCRTFPSARHARAWMDYYVTAERRASTVPYRSETRVAVQWLAASARWIMAVMAVRRGSGEGGPSPKLRTEADNSMRPTRTNA